MNRTSQGVFAAPIFPADPPILLNPGTIVAVEVSTTVEKLAVSSP